MPNRKVKICHVASVEMTVRLLLLPQLKFLISQGYDVFAVSSPGNLVKKTEEGVRVKMIPITRKISPLADIVSLFKLFFYFRKEKFTIVHTHGPKPGILGQLAAKLAGVPVVINTVHGLYFTENSSWVKRAFFIVMEKIAANCSTLIFSQNKEDMVTMVKEKIALPQKIKYLGNGVDTKKFDAENVSKDFIVAKKRELAFPSGVKIIGMVGRLVKEKGYFELFEAFKTVLQKHPNALLLVIGPEEPQKADTFNPNIVKNYGIENQVMFLGERTDMEQLYSLMDVFVLPSHREGFPRSVLEAMAARRPIIATNIRGCREEIDNGENGLLIPAQNSKALADAIAFLLENPDKASQMAENARAKAVREFDENLVFGRINKEYSRLIKEKIE